jgi:hypothetical protein
MYVIVQYSPQKDPPAGANHFVFAIQLIMTFDEPIWHRQDTMRISEAVSAFLGRSRRSLLIVLEPHI